MQNNEKDLKEMNENFEDSILTFSYAFEGHIFSCRIFYDRSSNFFEMIWHLGSVKFSKNINLIDYGTTKLNDGSNLVFHIMKDLVSSTPVLLISNGLFLEGTSTFIPKIYTFYMNVHQMYTLRMFFAKPNRLWKMEHF